MANRWKLTIENVGLRIMKGSRFVNQDSDPKRCIIVQYSIKQRQEDRSTDNKNILKERNEKLKREQMYLHT